MEISTDVYTTDRKAMSRFVQVLQFSSPFTNVSFTPKVAVKAIRPQIISAEVTSYGL
jgi:hypothetical protein